MPDSPPPLSSQENQPKPPRGGAAKILAFFIGMSLLIAVAFFCFHTFVGKPSLKPIEKFSEALANITQRKVTVSGNTVTLEKSEIMELALVQRKSQSVIKYHTRWLTSDNLLILRGDFIIKAGYDLSDSTSFKVENGLVSGTWPQAKILSVALADYEVYHSKNGSINRLKPEDQEAAVKQLLAQAKKDAQESDLLEEAQEALQRRFQDLSQDQFHLPQTWNAVPLN